MLTIHKYIAQETKTMPTIKGPKTQIIRNPNKGKEKEQDIVKIAKFNYFKIQLLETIWKIKDCPNLYFLKNNEIYSKLFY